VLITEGTIQTLAAANAAPPDVAVYGIAGCQSWMKCGVPSRDLSVVKGLDVFIVLDADAATNLNVYSAGVSLREAAVAEGAETVRFVRVPGGGKSGLDDVLASRSPEDRTTYLATLIDIARNRPKSEKPEQPAATKPRAKGSGDPQAESPYFTTTGGLQVKTLAESVIGNRPAALTRENKIALYMNGVYRIDGTGFLSEVANLLGENFRTSHQGNAEAYAVGMLKLGGIELPDRATQPLMNCRNVMVDLRTGESLPHDPSYFATVQLPVEWDPDATCPTYEAWARSQVGDQLDDLEESSSVMLDPSVTPTKAVFLFGPSRSGKGTFLRVLGALAGPDNVSSVSLHQLAENRFMAANVYGKILNASGDLSAAHVEDISIFKMLTGEDQITPTGSTAASSASPTGRCSPSPPTSCRRWGSPPGRTRNASSRSSSATASLGPRTRRWSGRS
jgi:putative DNA primase/helicase